MPVKSKNGPLVTLTRSPLAKSILSLGVSMPICLRIVLTSFSCSGTGFSPEPGEPTKPVTPERVAHDVPRLVVHVHLDEHVARKDFLRGDLALAVLELDFVFHRNEHAEDLLRHGHRVDAALEVGLDLVLVARVRVDHVPLPAFVLLSGGGGGGGRDSGASGDGAFSTIFPLVVLIQAEDVARTIGRSDRVRV